MDSGPTLTDGSPIGEDHHPPVAPPALPLVIALNDARRATNLRLVLEVRHYEWQAARDAGAIGSVTCVLRSGPNTGSGIVRVEVRHGSRPFVPHSMERVRQILEQFVAGTPGSRVEVKGASLAWHYRGAPREFAARQAHELRMLLGDLLSNQPLEVVEGKKMIEVRFRGVGKRVVAQRIEAEIATGTVVVAMGDDWTDEELFRALSHRA